MGNQHSEGKLNPSRSTHDHGYENETLGKNTRLKQEQLDLQALIKRSECRDDYFGRDLIALKQGNLSIQEINSNPSRITKLSEEERERNSKSQHVSIQTNTIMLEKTFSDLSQLNNASKLVKKLQEIVHPNILAIQQVSSNSNTSSKDCKLFVGRVYCEYYQKNFAFILKQRKLLTSEQKSKQPTSTQSTQRYQTNSAAATTSQSSSKDASNISKNINSASTLSYRMSITPRGSVPGSEKENLATSFTEKEVWYIMDSLINALKLLQEKKIIHGDLRPQMVYLTEQGYIKLSIIQCFAGDYSHSNFYHAATHILKGKSLHQKILDENTLLSLEQLAQLKQLNEINSDRSQNPTTAAEKTKQIISNLKFNPYKSQVFSLGMFLLQVIFCESVQCCQPLINNLIQSTSRKSLSNTLSPQLSPSSTQLTQLKDGRNSLPSGAQSNNKYLYAINEKTKDISINYQLIFDLLAHIKINYSPSLYKILNSCLDLNEDSRPDCIELFNDLHSLDLQTEASLPIDESVVVRTPMLVNYQLTMENPIKNKKASMQEQDILLQNSQQKLKPNISSSDNKTKIITNKILENFTMNSSQLHHGKSEGYLPFSSPSSVKKVENSYQPVLLNPLISAKSQNYASQPSEKNNNELQKQQIAATSSSCQQQQKQQATAANQQQTKHIKNISIDIVQTNSNSAVITVSTTKPQNLEINPNNYLVNLIESKVKCDNISLNSTQLEVPPNKTPQSILQAQPQKSSEKSIIMNNSQVQLTQMGDRQVTPLIPDSNKRLSVPSVLLYMPVNEVNKLDNKSSDLAQQVEQIKRSYKPTEGNLTNIDIKRSTQDESITRNQLSNVITTNCGIPQISENYPPKQQLDLTSGDNNINCNNNQIQQKSNHSINSMRYTSNLLYSGNNNHLSPPTSSTTSNQIPNANNYYSQQPSSEMGVINNSSQYLLGLGSGQKDRFSSDGGSITQQGQLKDYLSNRSQSITAVVAAKENNSNSNLTNPIQPFISNGTTRKQSEASQIPNYSLSSNFQFYSPPSTQNTQNNFMNAINKRPEVQAATLSHQRHSSMQAITTTPYNEIRNLSETKPYDKQQFMDKSSSVFLLKDNQQQSKTTNLNSQMSSEQSINIKNGQIQPSSAQHNSMRDILSPVGSGLAQKHNSGQVLTSIYNSCNQSQMSQDIYTSNQQGSMQKSILLSQYQPLNDKFNLTSSNLQNSFVFHNKPLNNTTTVENSSFYQSQIGQKNENNFLSSFQMSQPLLSAPVTSPKQVNISKIEGQISQFNPKSSNNTQVSQGVVSQVQQQIQNQQYNNIINSSYGQTYTFSSPQRLNTENNQQFSTFSPSDQFLKGNNNPASQNSHQNYNGLSYENPHLQTAKFVSEQSRHQYSSSLYDKLTYQESIKEEDDLKHVYGSPKKVIISSSNIQSPVNTMNTQRNKSVDFNNSYVFYQKQLNSSPQEDNLSQKQAISSQQQAFIMLSPQGRPSLNNQSATTATFNAEKSYLNSLLKTTDPNKKQSLTSFPEDQKKIEVNPVKDNNGINNGKMASLQNKQIQSNTFAQKKDSVQIDNSNDQIEIKEWNDIESEMSEVLQQSTSEGVSVNYTLSKDYKGIAPLQAKNQNHDLEILLSAKSFQKPNQQPYSNQINYTQKQQINQINQNLNAKNSINNLLKSYQLQNTSSQNILPKQITNIQNLQNISSNYNSNNSINNNNNNVSINNSSQIIKQNNNSQQQHQILLQSSKNQLQNKISMHRKNMSLSSYPERVQVNLPQKSQASTINNQSNISSISKENRDYYDIKKKQSSVHTMTNTLSDTQNNTTANTSILLLNQPKQPYIPSSNISNQPSTSELYKANAKITQITNLKTASNDTSKSEQNNPIIPINCVKSISNKSMMNATDNSFCTPYSSFNGCKKIAQQIMHFDTNSIISKSINTNNNTNSQNNNNNNISNVTQAKLNGMLQPMIGTSISNNSTSFCSPQFKLQPYQSNNNNNGNNNQLVSEYSSLQKAKQSYQNHPFQLSLKQKDKKVTSEKQPISTISSKMNTNLNFSSPKCKQLNFTTQQDSFLSKNSIL